MPKFNITNDWTTYHITGKQYGEFSVGIDDDLYRQPMIAVTVGSNTSSAVFFEYNQNSLKAAKYLVKLIKRGIKEKSND